MPYVCNLAKDNQLALIERIAHNLRGSIFSESVEQVIVNALHSKTEDLEDTLKCDGNALVYSDKNAKAFIRTIVGTAIEDELQQAVTCHSDMSRPTDRFKFLRAALQKIAWLLEHPRDCEILHFCDECGKVMFEGYSLTGDEYYCSDECLHQNYSQVEYLAMYSGLDHTCEKALQRVENMTDEELDSMHESSGSECFWTEWEAF